MSEILSTAQREALEKLYKRENETGSRMQPLREICRDSTVGVLVWKHFIVRDARDAGRYICLTEAGRAYCAVVFG